MNTRVQVEHCVTEMISGVDIVREQILVAAGEPLSLAQEDIELRGWSIECRINAEAAHKKFTPAPGPIDDSYREPSGPGVRVDSGVEGGYEVTPMYDPMVAKLIVWDVDREKATRRMLRALGEYDSGGLTTLIPFHEAILATEQWAQGETCRDLMEDRDWLKSTAPAPAGPPEPSEDGGEMVTRDYKVEVSGKLFEVKVIGAQLGAGGGAPAAGGKKPPKRERKVGGGGGASSTALVAPLQGTVFKVLVEAGAEVAEGDLICVIEAMKMENEITAHRAGKVTSLNIEVGAAVTSGDTLAVIE
jgi:acetyl-CoA/propionyl-CoA carboxylase biotin carboxyl carrier protein